MDIKTQPEQYAKVSGLQPDAAGTQKLLQNINLSKEDITQIATLDSHTRMTDGSAWIFPGGPYTMKYIWDEK